VKCKSDDQVIGVNGEEAVSEQNRSAVIEAVKKKKTKKTHVSYERGYPDSHLAML
jgi:hypothetical protein